jgi:hypothetical protein
MPKGYGVLMRRLTQIVRKNKLRSAILILAALVILAWASLNRQSGQVSDGSAIDDLLAAYEAGQFRVILTGNTPPIASPDGAYILSDGLYRVSDGRFFEQFDNAYFSPDGRYLVQRRDGVYRIHDLLQVVPIRSERIMIANGEHVVITGNVGFSDNGEYVTITGAGRYREESDSPSADGYGVFRLSDGKQIVESDSLVISFSSDSAYAATQEGIFRLSDGEKLFQITSPSGGIAHPQFSPDSAFVYAAYAGVFRLSDGVKVLETDDEIYFTPDMMYVVATSEGVFRISDWQRLYPLNHDPVYAYPPVFSANGQYVAIPDEGQPPEINHTFVYRVHDGALLFEIDGISSASFSPDGTTIAINNDGVYRLSDQQRLFEIQGEVGSWEFSNENAYFVASYDGIYRIADGQKLFDLKGGDHVVTFSPDGEHVAIDNDGLYRLSDQQKVFDLDGVVRSFTDDGAYIHVDSMSGDPDFSIYNVKNGRRFEHVELLDVSSGLLRVGNTVVVIDSPKH